MRPFKRKYLGTFRSNTDRNGAKRELPEKQPSSRATPIPTPISTGSSAIRKKECTFLAEQFSLLSNAFMSETAADAHVAVQRTSTEQYLEASQSEPQNDMVDKPTSDQLLRLVLEKHLQHVERMEEMEKQTNEPQKDWNPSMRVLLRVAVILQKNEAAQKLLDAQKPTRAEISEPQLSEEAQRIAKFSEVDRRLMREAGEKFLILLRRKGEEQP